MVPAEDQKVHIGTKQRFDTAYYHLAFNMKPTVEERYNYPILEPNKSLESYEHPKSLYQTCLYCILSPSYKKPTVRKKWIQ